MQHDRNIKGFTLLAMLLILTVIAIIITVSAGYNTQQVDKGKVDQATLQVQQILNAALAYYLVNGSWPECPNPGTGALAAAGSPSVSDLQTQGFLPNQINNPWGLGQFSYWCQTPANAIPGTGATFFVSSVANTAANAQQIAGRLPNSYYVSATKTFVGSVNVPGENIANARGLSFAGVYYGGSCVPAPTCPSGYQPNIFVLPGSLAGIDNQPTGCAGSSTSPPYDPSTCNAQVFPISTFSVFARGDINSNPTDPSTVLDCEVTSQPKASACQANDSGTAIGAGTLYWRVCFYLRTDQIVYPNTKTPGIDTPWGKMIGTIIAFTRCVPATEPSGSSDVFQLNVGATP